MSSLFILFHLSRRFYDGIAFPKGIVKLIDVNNIHVLFLLEIVKRFLWYLFPVEGLRCKGLHCSCLPRPRWMLKMVKSCRFPRFSHHCSRLPRKTRHRCTKKTRAGYRGFFVKLILIVPCLMGRIKDIMVLITYRYRHIINEPLPFSILKRQNLFHSKFPGKYIFYYQ